MWEGLVWNGSGRMSILVKTWIEEMLSDFTIGTNKVAAFTYVGVHMPF